MTVRRLGVGDEAIAEAAVARFTDQAAGGPAVDVVPFLSSPGCVLLVSLEREDDAPAGWVYGHEPPTPRPAACGRGRRTR